MKLSEIIIVQYNGQYASTHNIMALISTSFTILNCFKLYLIMKTSYGQIKRFGRMK